MYAQEFNKNCTNIYAQMLQLKSNLKLKCKSRLKVCKLTEILTIHNALVCVSQSQTIGSTYTMN